MMCKLPLTVLATEVHLSQTVLVPDRIWGRGPQAPARHLGTRSPNASPRGHLGTRSPNPARHLGTRSPKTSPQRPFGDEVPNHQPVIWGRGPQRQLPRGHLGTRSPNTSPSFGDEVPKPYPKWIIKFKIPTRCFPNCKQIHELFCEKAWSDWCF